MATSVIFGGPRSKEAQAGIRACQAVTQLMRDKFHYRLTLLFADTEEDLPEVVSLNRSHQIDYHQAVADEIRQVREEITDLHVASFSEMFAERFRQKQYQIEQQLRQTNSIQDKISKISIQRATKYHEILGRPEQNHELTVRYMAQYAALGEILRQQPNPIAINYHTPNIPFYNFLPREQRKTLKGQERIQHERKNIIPILISNI